MLASVVVACTRAASNACCDIGQQPDTEHGLMCNAALVYVHAGLVFGTVMCRGVSGLMRTLELSGVLQLNYWASHMILVRHMCSAYRSCTCVSLTGH